MAASGVRGSAHRLVDHVHRLLHRLSERRGQGMVEYAFILMMVAIALILIVSVIGTQTGNMYNNISNSLNH